MNIFFIICVLFDKVSFITFLVLAFLSILFGLFEFVVISFLQSFEFFRKGLSRFFTESQQVVASSQGQYPVNFYEKFRFKNIFLISTRAYVALFLVVYVKTSNLFVFFEFEMLVFVLLILASSFGVWINWHYGLKKYEAFG
ncbi:MAG: hypothetical protein JXM74_04530 [Fusobacteriaceae bacterium]|nr:hypothetical protein [Fusobacteriaceae bacterium]